MPWEVGIRFTAEAAEAAFQSDTVRVEASSSGASPLRTFLQRLSPVSCTISPLSSRSSPSTYIHILGALLLSTYPWPHISLQRPLSIPLLFKFLVRVIFSVLTFSNILFKSSPLETAFVKVTNDLQNVKGRGNVKARWTVSYSPLRGVLFIWLSWHHSWFSSHTAVTSLSLLLDRPLLANF